MADYRISFSTRLFSTTGCGLDAGSLLLAAQPSPQDKPPPAQHYLVNIRDVKQDSPT